MKVAVELQPCLKNRSGIGVYTYELSKRLQRDKNIQLTGDVFNFLQRNDLSQDLLGIEFKQEICKLFPYGIYRRIWHYLPIKYNRLFKRTVDITHFFNFIVPPRINGKVITTIYDLTFEFFPETMDKRNLKRLKDDISYSVQRANHIITISECSKKDIIEVMGVSSNKIDIVYPGVDFEYFSRSRTLDTVSEVRNKYQLPKQYILYMGTLEPRKNIPSIIEAFYRLKQQGIEEIRDIKLVIAGKKGWLFEEIFNKVAGLGLEKEVIFTDYVAEGDKAVIYKEAKAFVFPSLYEGFGIPVVEAMAAGIPVITSNVSSLPEIAGEAALLVNPYDSTAISEKLKQLLIDEQYREKLVKKGLKQAKKFSWDSSVQKLKEIYEKVMLYDE